MVEEIYKDIVDNMTWSYSRLKCFEDCGYRWFMKYILDMEEAPMFYSSYGKYVHDLIAMYNMGFIDKDDLSKEFVLGFSSAVEGDRPAGTTVAKYLQKGIDYFRNFEPLPYNVVGTEKLVTFSIDKYKFVGFIDLLGERNGDLYVIDHKSRDLKKRSKRKNKTKNDETLDEMYKQLYLYAEAVKQEYGIYPKKLIFNCFKAGTLIEEEFSEEGCEMAKQWAIGVINDIRSATEFNPDIEYFKCKNLCGLNNECCYWKGE